MGREEIQMKRPDGPHFTYTDSEGNETYETIGGRKHAVKNVEMTVRRALRFIQLFEEWEERFNKSGRRGVQDWRDIDPKEYRKIYGDDYMEVSPQNQLEELWERYKSGSLYREVQELADNLVLEDLSKTARRQIENGLVHIRKRTN